MTSTWPSLHSLPVLFEGPALRKVRTVIPTRFILYVVRTSVTPDRCEGGVPWRVDGDEIFFGPCKKRLRRALRERFLGPERQLAEVARREWVVIAGVNASQGTRPRKLVWAGELLTVMSFAEAWARLDGPRYAKLRASASTPVHLEPIRERGRLVGYRHHGLEHVEHDSWWDDLVPPQMRRARVSLASSTTLRLADGVDWWDGFPLDASLLLRNRFWAEGAGLPLDEEPVRLLQAAQPDARQVDAAAPFGLDGRGSANGKRGTYLELEGSVAAALADWLDASAPSSWTPGASSSVGNRPARKC
jgi:hypothetical protein